MEDLVQSSAFNHQAHGDHEEDFYFIRLSGKKKTLWVVGAASSREIK
jgi:hypothetical protein